MPPPLAARTFAQIAAAQGLPAPVAKRAPAQPFSVPVRILKADTEKRTVWGWVSIVSKAGSPVVDLQGDVMDADELERAMHDYVRRSRVGKRQHRGAPAMELVESVVLTKAKQAAMGVDLGFEGAWAGFYVHDDATWEAAKAGKLTGFSIGGSGVRTPLEE